MTTSDTTPRWVIEKGPIEAPEYLMLVQRGLSWTMDWTEEESLATRCQSSEAATELAATTNVDALRITELEE